MGNLGYWAEKAVYLTVGLGVTLWVLAGLKVWGMGLNNYFLLMGDFESLAIIALITFGATLILENLWKWLVRSIFKNNRRRK